MKRILFSFLFFPSGVASERNKSYAANQVMIFAGLAIAAGECQGYALCRLGCCSSLWGVCLRDLADR